PTASRTWSPVTTTSRRSSLRWRRCVAPWRSDSTHTNHNITKLPRSVSVNGPENGQRQREQLANHFDCLVAILEERKQELVGLISRQQDDKLKHVRSLIRRHSDQLEAAVTLVESAIQSMEEPHMPLFIQSAKLILENMAATARASNVKRPELGYENMSHFVIDTDDLADMLRNIDFCPGVGDDGEEDPEEEESDLDFGSRY
uniref:Tripartite motif containing 54 n=1 Tax=Lates calcarifer TaxID=8187 RepID=A0A4W6DES4_LATCA